MAAYNTDVKKVEEYKLSVITKAEGIVKSHFPDHIIEFNKLLEGSTFTCLDLQLTHSDLHIPTPPPAKCWPQTDIENNGAQAGGNSSKKRCLDADQQMSNSPTEGTNMCCCSMNGTKVYLLPLGCVPINATITSMVDTIKPLIKTLVEEVNVLKMWVAFLIPKIEDGNNFGVGIQEETLEEIRSVEGEASAFYEQIGRYYINRAKLVSKVAKYPHIDDYRRAVDELDEKQFLSLRITLTEMRNHYAALHDMIHKNMEKIKKPRSINSHEAMY